VAENIAVVDAYEKKTLAQLWGQVHYRRELFATLPGEEPKDKGASDEHFLEFSGRDAVGVIFKGGTAMGPESFRVDLKRARIDVLDSARYCLKTFTLDGRLLDEMPLRRNLEASTIFQGFISANTLGPLDFARGDDGDTYVLKGIHPAVERYSAKENKLIQVLPLTDMVNGYTGHLGLHNGTLTVQGFRRNTDLMQNGRTVPKGQADASRDRDDLLLDHGRRLVLHRVSNTATVVGQDGLPLSQLDFSTSGEPQICFIGEDAHGDLFFTVEGFDREWMKVMKFGSKGQLLAVVPVLRPFHANRIQVDEDGNVYELVLGGLVINPDKPWMLYDHGKDAGRVEIHRWKFSEAGYSPHARPTAQVREDWKEKYTHLADRNAKELRFLRNEVYARRGRIFKDQELQGYFSKQAWYSPDKAYSDARLDADDLKMLQDVRTLEQELADR